MKVLFDQLSDEACIWIYQADRALTMDEQVTLLIDTDEFLDNWTSHGQPLKCSYVLLYDQFLILSVEEQYQGATGCAIDASIQFLQTLEKKLKLRFLDRTQLAFMHDETVVLVPMSQIEAKIQEGVVTSDMYFFDNTITKKGDMLGQWIVNVQDTWLAKYFKAA